jgi:hypothetical protein
VKPAKTVRHKNAFMIADVMMALGLLGVTAVIFISAVNRTDRASDKLANTRYAGHVAEEVLSNLQANLPTPQSDPDTKISIDPTEGGAPIPGHHWVQVTVTHQGQSAALTGLVPDSAAAPSGGAR